MLHEKSKTPLSYFHAVFIDAGPPFNYTESFHPLALTLAEIIPASVKCAEGRGSEVKTFQTQSKDFSR